MAAEKIEKQPCAFTRLADLVKALRGENGCPWDKKQTSQSMAVKLLEETYELVDAINKGDADGVCEELGDVLFHIFFIARLFEEQGRFGIENVADGITQKMIRRHPHVFGGPSVASTEEVKQQWHAIKQSERTNGSFVSVLDSVPRMQPGLIRAYRVSARAAREGFDWENTSSVMQKMEEELGELKEAAAKAPGANGENPALRLEFGDLLFTMVNVARFLGINPEAALTESIEKFENRFRHMERVINDSHRKMTDVNPEEKDDIWEHSKAVTDNPPAET
jgi:tetrapyrrole methylase family protein/MazG family protein